MSYLIRYVHFSQDSWVTKLRFNCGTQISQGKINAEKNATPKNKPAAAKRMKKTFQHKCP